MAGSGNSEFDPELVISHKFPESLYTYTERDAALYALGIGACTKDAIDDKELKYAYHQDGQEFIQVFLMAGSDGFWFNELDLCRAIVQSAALAASVVFSPVRLSDAKVLPTFSTLFSLGVSSQIEQLPGMQYDPRLLLHGQQYIEIYKPLPSHGCILNKASIAGLHDKGKATVLEIEIVSYEKESGDLLCMNRLAIYLRGAGGFSKSSQPYSYSSNRSNQSAFPKIPKSQPFAVFEECTHASQALLYRLSGDYNPLHSDPKVAEIAGFSRPILHGLCTLGFAVRAIIKCICRGEQNIIKNISGRFLLHVYPGETLITEMWLAGLRIIYQVKVKERNRAVLSGFVDLDRLSSSL